MARRYQTRFGKSPLPFNPTKLRNVHGTPTLVMASRDLVLSRSCFGDSRGSNVASCHVCVSLPGWTPHLRGGTAGLTSRVITFLLVCSSGTSQLSHFRIQPLNSPFYQFSHLQNGDCILGRQGVVSANECFEARWDLQINEPQEAPSANEPWLLSNLPWEAALFPTEEGSAPGPWAECLSASSGGAQTVDFQRSSS